MFIILKQFFQKLFQNYPIIKMKENVQSFLASIALHQILPLIPLVIEYKYLGFVSDRSLTMTASIYSFSIGVSSRSQATLGLCILIGILMAASYGAVKECTSENHPEFYEMLAFWLIALVFIIHFIERYRRHIMEDEEYIIIKRKGAE